MRWVGELIWVRHSRQRHGIEMDVVSMKRTRSDHRLVFRWDHTDYDFFAAGRGTLPRRVEVPLRPARLTRQRDLHSAKGPTILPMISSNIRFNG
jgi:hypothetical protein